MLDFRDDKILDHITDDFLDSLSLSSTERQSIIEELSTRFTSNVIHKPNLIGRAPTLAKDLVLAWRAKESENCTAQLTMLLSDNYDAYNKLTETMSKANKLDIVADVLESFNSFEISPDDPNASNDHVRILTYLEFDLKSLKVDLINLRQEPEQKAARKRVKDSLKKHLSNCKSVGHLEKYNILVDAITSTSRRVRPAKSSVAVAYAQAQEKLSQQKSIESSRIFDHLNTAFSTQPDMTFMNKAGKQEEIVRQLGLPAGLYKKGTTLLELINKKSGGQFPSNLKTIEWSKVDTYFGEESYKFFKSLLVELPDSDEYMLKGLDHSIGFDCDILVGTSQNIIRDPLASYRQPHRVLKLEEGDGYFVVKNNPDNSDYYPQLKEDLNPITETTKSQFGSGSFGRVRLGELITATGPESVALKKMSLNKKSEKDIKKEANVFKKLKTIGGIYVGYSNRFCSFREGKTHKAYLANEILGESLKDSLRNKRLTQTNKLLYAKQIIDTIGTLNNHGVFHRDIKPDNIMLTTDQKEARCIDWGFCVLDASKESNLGDYGSPGYLAPELYTPAKNGKSTNYAQAKIDAFAVGITLCELFDQHTVDVSYTSYHKKFEFDQYINHILNHGSIPDDLKPFLTAIMKENPEERQTIDEAYRLLLPRSLKRDGGLGAPKIAGADDLAETSDA